MDFTWETVRALNGYERFTTADGRRGAKVLYKDVIVCSYCVRECEGSACSKLDWDKHANDVRDELCMHCNYCEGDEADKKHCHDNREHVCGWDTCFNCGQCDDCYEDCCWDIDWDYHYAEHYPIYRENAEWVCANGHSHDGDVIERLAAVNSMKAAGVKPLF